MPRRKATRASELIKISIHSLVYSGQIFEKHICGVDLALIPEYRNGQFLLAVYVDGRKQEKVFNLVEKPWGNRRLLNGGCVPPHKENHYYVVASNGKLRRFIYIDPKRGNVGPQDDIPGFHWDSQCLSAKQCRSWKEAREIRNPKRMTERQKVEAWVAGKIRSL